MEHIYFDNSATTKISEKAAAAMKNVIDAEWGNPSAVYAFGASAAHIVNDARADVVKALGVKNPRSGQLFFVASGTEADNLAISGTVYGKKYRFKPRIITTDSEHPAVLNTVREAEMNGFDVVRLSTVGGVIDLDELENALTPETVLISVMRVNNETGAIYDVPGIFGLAKRKCPEIITHCDAVQGFAKINCAPQKLGADLVTVSGHKIGGPKGVGALWCGEELIFRKKLKPIIFGGGQESGMRSGTENTVGIAGMGAAASERAENMQSDFCRVTALREYLISNLPENTEVNQPKGEFLPNIISLYVPNVKSEVLVRYMSSEGISISAGSACSSKKLKTSATLTAFGLAPDRADSTVRVSISHSNTEAEADRFASVLADAVKKLAKKK